MTQDTAQKGFSPVILVVIAFVVLLIVVFGYSVGSNPVVQKQVQVNKSLDSTSLDIPKGNSHWDKAEVLFTQIKAEQDQVKVKQLNVQITDELNQVLADQPKNGRVWYELGAADSWVTLTDPQLADKGLSAYKKAEELDPTNVIYINGVGDQLILMERWDDAILQFQKTLRLTPNSGFGNLSLCKAYVGAKIYDSAKLSCQKAVDTFSNIDKDGKYDDEILEAKKIMAGMQNK